MHIVRGAYDAINGCVLSEEIREKNGTPTTIGINFHNRAAFNRDAMESVR